MTGGNLSSGTGRIDVLVVDDQADVASSTADILGYEGLNTTAVGTVDDALRVISTGEVRCVILDHHLVGEDGERLLAVGRYLPPVVVISGMDSDSLAEVHAAHRDRLFACLAKPVPPLKLIEVVRAAIASP